MSRHTNQCFRMYHIEDVFRHTLVFCLLAFSRGGQANANVQSQPLIVKLGEDVVLPCRLDPPVDAVSMTVEWGRPDLKPRFVFVRHEGKQLVAEQNEAYKKRVSLSTDKLKHGDVSLTLPKVRVSDNGTYRCYIPKKDKEYFVDLLVGSVSSPDISMAGIDQVSGGVMLDCVSKRWFPQPEVSWLDSEGKLLSAGPTEAVRGPDGLFTVSSRVTVEKRHNNNFTCRLHQRNINQTRASHLHVPDDFFVVPSSCSSCIAISVLLGFMFIFAVVVGVWRWRKSKMERQMDYRKTEDGEDKGANKQLMMESKKKEDFETKKKLKDELQRRQNEQKEMAPIEELLERLKVELKTKKDHLSGIMLKAETQIEEREERIQSVEQEVSAKQGDNTSSKAEAYYKLMAILNEENWTETKEMPQDLDVFMDRLVSQTTGGLGKISDIKDKAENDMERIKEEIDQLEKSLKKRWFN